MSKSILIVEDDEDIAKNLQELLEEEGYGVVHCSNGSSALSYLDASSAALPSLILLDIMMPVMDGFQFREQQQLDPRIASLPVIVMTADGNIEEKRKKMGAQAYVRKPLDLLEFLDTIERCCG